MSTCDTHVTESGTLAFRVALSVLRHREDAEDVAQEAVVRSLQRFESLKDRARFRAWLVRIAWRLALDRRRADTRRAVREFRFIENDSAHGSAERDLIARERADRLWAAVDGLPPRLRLPLVLGTLQGYSLDEVASLLGVPVGTVKSRTFEARQKLKQALTGTGVFVVLTALTMSMLSVQRVQFPDVPPAASTSAELMPRSLSVPSPSRSLPVSMPAAFRAAPAAADQVDPVSPAAGQIPVVAVPSLTVKTVKISVVTIPVVQLPIVDVTSVDVPTVKRVLVWAPETHEER